MKIKECAYFIKEPDLISDYGICCLFPTVTRFETRFNTCEVIPISKCPYKLFMERRIDAEELNKQIKQILGEKASKNE